MISFNNKLFRKTFFRYFSQICSDPIDLCQDIRTKSLFHIVPHCNFVSKHSINRLTTKQLSVLKFFGKGLRKEQLWSLTKNMSIFSMNLKAIGWPQENIYYDTANRQSAPTLFFQRFSYPFTKHDAFHKENFGI